MKKAKKLLTVFGLLLLCNTVQGMKRKAEDVNPLLLHAVEERWQEAPCGWHDEITSAIQKKMKFEALLAEVDVAIMAIPVMVPQRAMPQVIVPVGMSNRGYRCNFCFFETDYSYSLDRHVKRWHL